MLIVVFVARRRLLKSPLMRIIPKTLVPDQITKQGAIESNKEMWFTVHLQKKTKIKIRFARRAKTGILDYLANRPVGITITSSTVLFHLNVI